MARPVVLITGGSKGIGAACARLFAAEGWDVCLTYLSDPEGADQTVRDCHDVGAAAHAVRTDMTSHDDVTDAFAQCDSALGKPVCVIANAGIIGSAGTLLDLTPDALNTTFTANVFGPVWCIQQATRRMATSRDGQGGTIILMGSLAAVTGSPNEYVHYAASKAAIETLAVGAGKELAPDGIRVNAIRVGTTNSTLHARSGNPDRPETIAAATPMGRIAEPEDIAKTALWLASGGSGFVTGTVITVAGGLMR